MGNSNVSTDISGFRVPEVGKGIKCTTENESFILYAFHRITSPANRLQFRLNLKYSLSVVERVLCVSQMLYHSCCSSL